MSVQSARALDEDCCDWRRNNRAISCRLNGMWQCCSLWERFCKSLFVCQHHMHRVEASMEVGQNLPGTYLSCLTLSCSRSIFGYSRRLWKKTHSGQQSPSDSNQSALPAWLSCALSPAGPRLVEGTSSPQGPLLSSRQETLHSVKSF